MGPLFLTDLRHWGRKAMSLPEVMVTITIIAILATLAITYFGDSRQHARRGIATDTLQKLNRGVLNYGQVVGEISVAADLGSDDELAVLGLLQTRDSSHPGSPYFSENVVMAASTSDGEIRYQWTGKFFQLIPEGTEGAGILIEP